jgi:hypothetical protein
MMLSIFREEPTASGPGPVSARRVTALACFFLFAPAAAVLAYMNIDKLAGAGIALEKWVIVLFLPCVLFVAAGLILYFFTTWADINSVISSARGKGA